MIVVGQLLGYADLPTSQGGARADDETSYQIFRDIKSWNAALSNEFGDWFYDAQAVHVAGGGGESKTINPNGTSKTYTVLTATAATPKLSDGIHENTSGQNGTAAGLAAQMAARSL